jgi:ribosome biogenesis GTPase / thiamine phosphate phosphatase
MRFSAGKSMRVAESPSQPKNDILLYMKKGRIIEEHKTSYILSSEGVDYTATVRGSFFDTDNFPKVGDCVEYSEVADGKTVIESILPRTSSIVRKSVETGLPQTIVTNVDLIFIVMGLDGDFNLSRLERYLLLAKQSNIEAVILLNKSDMVDGLEETINKVKEIAGETPVLSLSALTGENMSSMLPYLKEGITAVLLGSSGAGKSTITNWLLNEDKQSVADVRGDDSRGRHTTTSKQLFSLPTGGYLIDTPGMRELGVVDSSEEDEKRVFLKIEKLSSDCQFNNCDHEKSKGCAVVKAVESGEISNREIESYHKLKKERLEKETQLNQESIVKKKREQKRSQHKQAKADAGKGFNQEDI